MFNKYIGAAVFMLLCLHAIGQESLSDTLTPVSLDEVIVIAPRQTPAQKVKPYGSVDDYLESSGVLNMLRRGPYAAEPLINGMSSERSIITIDGMRIYAACTDKMDPVTSYVEITNLSAAHIQSGAMGSSGASIAGSIDLQRRKSHFGSTKNNFGLFSGYESNNQLKLLGASGTFRRKTYYADFDLSMRDAENYRIGGGAKQAFSQYSKYNMGATLGWRTNSRSEIVFSSIYDRAVDVGYPALPMDVRLAEAMIASVQYRRKPLKENLAEWTTKLYGNHVRHIMDDSQRPNVPIRMDMPGRSTTLGGFSQLKGQKNGQHKWRLDLNGHFNRSYAEMTMYANHPGEKDMFMLTWPDVHTYYVDASIDDTWRLASGMHARVSLGLAAQRNQVANEMGQQSLRIFYPEMRPAINRLLKRGGLTLHWHQKIWNAELGLSYAERAPSVSEAYGFYLFNSYDGYDYLGNPNLAKESAVVMQAAWKLQLSRLSAGLQLNQHWLHNYIVGMPKAHYNAMTIGAAGVKQYEQLTAAQIFNAVLQLSYRPHRLLLWDAQWTYRYGDGRNFGPLPMIQPLSYRSWWHGTFRQWGLAFGLEGAASQRRVSIISGESGLPAYVLLHANAYYRWQGSWGKFLIKGGVDNLSDRYYTTFADWNRLPRPGRNIYLHLNWEW